MVIRSSMIQAFLHTRHACRQSSRPPRVGGAVAPWLRDGVQSLSKLLQLLLMIASQLCMYTTCETPIGGNLSPKILKRKHLKYILLVIVGGHFVAVSLAPPPAL